MNVIKPYRFMPKQEIENRANNILQEIQTKRKRSLEWRYLADAVADFLDIGVTWESIPADNQGKIAAMILPLDREIIINKDIPALHGGFGQSTVAHEIGHWLLHINKEAVGKFIERQELGIETAIKPLLCRSVTSQRGIEWQAQYFASCLLMPINKLEEVAKGRNLTKWRHLYAMTEELGVTISNLKNRLQSLGWIIVSDNSKQIYPGNSAPSLYNR